MKIVEYAKAHPWATGIIVIIGGIIFFMIFTGGGSSSDSSSGGSTPRASDAEIAANATIEAAKIQAMFGVQQAQIGAGVQMNSDNKAAEVAMQQLLTQKELGIKQIDSNTTLGLGQQEVDKVGIAAQKDMYIAGQNAQVQTQQIIANASKKKGGGINIGGILGGIASIGSLFSDQRLKENIRLAGTDRRGRNVYEFNYKGSKTKRLGYIAQDIARSEPDKVSVDNRSGMLRVDYWSGPEMARII